MTTLKKIEELGEELVEKVEALWPGHEHIGALPGAAGEHLVGDGFVNQEDFGRQFPGQQPSDQRPSHLLFTRTNTLQPEPAPVEAPPAIDARAPAPSLLEALAPTPAPAKEEKESILSKAASSAE